MNILKDLRRNYRNIKEQLAKANCSVLQGGTRRKDYHGIYSIDGILSFIQGRKKNDRKNKS
ncbi:hypothetical protein DY471_10540 [Bacillus anthracis]|nr:hypothetical protein DY471_10540 [Bacillus anthracis]